MIKQLNASIPLYFNPLKSCGHSPWPTWPIMNRLSLTLSLPEKCQAMGTFHIPMNGQELFTTMLQQRLQQWGGRMWGGKGMNRANGQPYRMEEETIPELAANPPPPMKMSKILAGVTGVPHDDYEDINHDSTWRFFTAFFPVNEDTASCSILLLLRRSERIRFFTPRNALCVFLQEHCCAVIERWWQVIFLQSINPPSFVWRKKNKTPQ